MLLSSGREAAERPGPVRERLEAAVSGLEELDYLRRRQEDLVRAAMEVRGAEEEKRRRKRRREGQLSSEENLEENILLLRTQLNCLRRRDAGLVSQLQELDRQISDLRLDAETSHDPPETDSRPSSGFFELSDAASGSLSNSSNSVFSECFCVLVDPDGRPPPAATASSARFRSLSASRLSDVSSFPSADDLPGCSDCDGPLGGLWEDPRSGGTVRRSVSAPEPPDAASKCHCDPVSRGGANVFHYPSPLHAVSVQSPRVLQGVSREEAQASSISSSSSTSSQSPSPKRLDSYILLLLQRRLPPVRTCQTRTRTSISTEPSKGVLRSAGLCGRQLAGPGSETLMRSEPPPSHQVSWSPPREFSVEGGKEEQETPEVSLGGSKTDRSGAGSPHNASSVPHKEANMAPPAPPAPRPHVPETNQSCPFNLLLPPPPPPPLQVTMASTMSRGHEGVSVSAHHKVQKGEDRRSGRAEGAAAPRTRRAAEPPQEGGADKQHRRVRVTRHLMDGGSAPSARVLERAGTSTPRNVRSGVSKHRHGNHHRHHCHGNHHRHHRHRPESIGGDRRRSGLAPAVPSNEAFRDVFVTPAAREPIRSGYARKAGSDSEYSAECASLFHSTIVDTSEDDKSNATTNRFGDGESGEDSSLSNTEEGGAGRGGQQQLTMTPGQPKSFIKIRASHNLKKKLLRFRSGSLKLMTTV